MSRKKNISEDERAKRLLEKKREMGRTLGKLPDTRTAEERRQSGIYASSFKKKQKAIIEETLKEMKREEAEKNG